MRLGGTVVCERPDDLLEQAVTAWSKAQVVYEGPTRLGMPDELLLVEAIAEHPDCEQGLIALLSSPRQLVVAYALMSLHRMGSRFLANLPGELLGRRDKITLSYGCFRNSMDLGGLAHQYRKEARKKDA